MGRQVEDDVFVLLQVDVAYLRDDFGSLIRTLDFRVELLGCRQAVGIGGSDGDRHRTGPHARQSQLVSRKCHSQQQFVGCGRLVRDGIPIRIIEVRTQVDRDGVALAHQLLGNRIRNRGCAIPVLDRSVELLGCLEAAGVGRRHGDRRFTGRHRDQSQPAARNRRSEYTGVGCGRRVGKGVTIRVDEVRRQLDVDRVALCHQLIGDRIRSRRCPVRIGVDSVAAGEEDGNDGSGREIATGGGQRPGEHWVLLVRECSVAGGSMSRCILAGSAADSQVRRSRMDETAPGPTSRTESTSPEPGGNPGGGQGFHPYSVPP